MPVSAARNAWNADQIPDQSGRLAVITGATSGIGMEAARVLAQKQAKVILAVRNVAKGEDVAKAIRTQAPAAEVSVRELDLSSLASIQRFAEALAGDRRRLDLLINNAGVMMCPYAQTRDGFEIQFGTNHLGHFALTLRLLPLLAQARDSRVVTVSSLAHKRGKLDFSDLGWSRRRYSTVQAYCDSKLANLYFTYELARRIEAAGANPKVTAAHPGWTATDLQRHLGIFKHLNPLFGQSIVMGALPTLRAAIDDAEPGDYFGPDGFLEQKGHPVAVRSTALARNADAARRLWSLSEEMTGLRYPQ